MSAMRWRLCYALQKREDRFIMVGQAAGTILVVVFTERKDRIRMISAREAREHERRNYFRAAQED
jgi:uncharacterized protein